MGKIGDMEEEIKRLRHHVSVLSKRNHRLMKDGKSRAVSPIASDVSLTDREEEEEDKCGPGRVRVTIVATEEQLVDVVRDVGIEWGLIRGVEATGRVERVGERGVEAESVALVEGAEVAEPMVRVPVAVKREGSKKRRVEVSKSKDEEVKRDEMLIAPLGPRAKCGGLLRKVGRKSVFAGADPRYGARGGPSQATSVGLSQEAEARRQCPGARGGYQLRPRVGGYGLGYGGRGRERGF